MLRIVVIGLVVANLLLFGFEFSKPKDQPESPTPQTLIDAPEVPTILLFSELTQDQKLMSGNRQCFSLGPFNSIEERVKIRQRLPEISSDIGERETEAMVEKGYWVYMPPYVSLLEANQALLSLQALGLKDIAVILEGKWKNAVSLGYFLRQENALRRKKSLEEKGYTPSTRVKRQAERRYWLDYEQIPGSDLLALDIKNQPLDFTHRSIPCLMHDMFASTAGSPQILAGDMTRELEPEDDAASQAVESTDVTVKESVGSLSDEGVGVVSGAAVENRTETETDGG